MCRPRRRWAPRGLTREHVVVLVHAVQPQPLVQSVQLVGAQHLALPVGVAWGTAERSGPAARTTAPPDAPGARPPARALPRGPRPGGRGGDWGDRPDASLPPTAPLALTPSAAVTADGRVPAPRQRPLESAGALRASARGLPWNLSYDGRDAGTPTLGKKRAGPTQLHTCPPSLVGAPGDVPTAATRLASWYWARFRIQAELRDHCPPGTPAGGGAPRPSPSPSPTRSRCGQSHSRIRP